MVSELISLSEVVCDSLPLSRQAGRQGPPVRALRALQMSAGFSQSEKGKKDGPLTKDSCQSDGALTLGSPMSSDKGDECLASHRAMKSQPLPALNANTGGDNMHGFLVRLHSYTGSLPALSSLSSALVLLERPRPMGSC